jgi:hypothetical protein
VRREEARRVVRECDAARRPRMCSAVPNVVSWSKTASISFDTQGESYDK